MQENLALIGALHLRGFNVENSETNEAGDVMFDIAERGER